VLGGSRAWRLSDGPFTWRPSSNLLLTTLTSAIIVNDGETMWLEGVALTSMHCIIAAAFWWG
jgi:hypothetical protein